LIEYFLKENSSTTNFSEKSIDLLKKYHWPGNVQELQNLIIRLVALYPNQKIQEDLLLQSLQKRTKKKLRLS